MDECEYLCNRLAIMSGGQLKCIGPIQNLKDSFGLGFVVHIVFNERSMENDDNILNVKNELKSQFSHCELQEEYAVRSELKGSFTLKILIFSSRIFRFQGRLTFIIKEPRVVWSDVFKKIDMIRMKYSHFITDISVNETSLEDIFLQIANQRNQTRNFIDVTSV